MPKPPDSRARVIAETVALIIIAAIVSLALLACWAELWR